MVLIPAVQASGSSPLARGTREFHDSMPFRWGLIPARAGNTFIVPSESTVDGAHPRSRGEHLCFLAKLFYLTGSSPLARGTRLMFQTPRWAFGLIPARAGNTSTPYSIRTLARAHPRSRGEHECECECHETVGGSSPLARGTRVVSYPLFGAVGLIPARAGNTSGWRGTFSMTWAHPRSRGEHT